MVRNNDVVNPAYWLGPEQRSFHYGLLQTVYRKTQSLASPILSNTLRLPGGIFHRMTSSQPGNWRPLRSTSLFIVLAAAIFCGLFGRNRPDTTQQTAVVAFFAKLHESKSSQSPLVRVLEDGARLEILAENGEWLNVRAGADSGWTLKKNVHVQPAEAPERDTQARTPALTDSRLLAALAIAALAGLLTAAALYFVRFRRQFSKRSHTTKLLCVANQIRNCVLVLSSTDKNVRCAVSNHYKKLSVLFANLGYTAIFIHDIAELHKSLSFKPSMFAVDYALCRGVIKRVEKLFSLPFLETSMPVIFYNVPNPAAISPSSLLTNAVYLGKAFTDQNVCKALTAAMHHSANAAEDDVFLHGKISRDGLFEVLQLIEIGHKTGILVINDESGEQLGAISFRQGIITYAHCDTPNPSLGEDAVIQLLTLRAGSFDFFLDKAFGQEHCSIAPTEIMLSCMKMLDEQKRDNSPSITSSAL